MVGGKVDGQILFGTRSEKRNNFFGTKWQLRKFLFGSQRVKLKNIFLQDMKNYFAKFHPLANSFPKSVVSKAILTLEFMVEVFSLDMSKKLTPSLNKCTAWNKFSILQEASGNCPDRNVMVIGSFCMTTHAAPFWRD